MKKYEKHEIHEAVTHLMNAHEVMKDPELMKLVKEKMKGAQKITSIQDLKEAASESQKEEEGEHETKSTEDMENEGLNPLGNYGKEEPNVKEGATTLSGKKQ